MTLNTSETSSLPDKSTRNQNPGLDTPGKLRSEAKIVIQTRQAQKLVKGRERSECVQPIIGMLSFGYRMKQLWLSAQHDDPYADWYLLQIEQSMDTAHQYCQIKMQELNDILAGMDGIHLDIAYSLAPIEVPLQFSNPYGYRGAYLIADYDALTRTVLTARHFGLMDRSTSEVLIKQAGRSIRRSFRFVALWKYTGVTRRDFDPINPNAQQAQALMGEIPDEILSSALRAKIAPAIRQTDLITRAVRSRDSTLPFFPDQSR